MRNELRYYERVLFGDLLVSTINKTLTSQAREKLCYPIP